MFKARREDKLNKKFVLAVWASFADILKCLRYQELREMINRRIFKYIEFILFSSMFCWSPLYVSFLKRTLLLKL